MPYATTWEEAGVLWTFRGEVTGDEILRANQEVYRDPRFHQLTYQIVDLTGVERFDVTEDEIAMVAVHDRAAARSRPSVRVAVAATDEIIKDLSAFYDAVMVGSPWHQRIFDSEREAREWLSQSHDAP
jgi:gamma-glutamyl-gamma-aminobutyrate hydrolase PuuD